MIEAIINANVTIQKRTGEHTLDASNEYGEGVLYKCFYTQDRQIPRFLRYQNADTNVEDIDGIILIEGAHDFSPEDRFALSASWWNFEMTGSVVGVKVLSLVMAQLTMITYKRDSVTP